MAQPFDHSDAPNKMGAPLFAFCAKGGRDAACSANFDIAQVQYYKKHHTRPCQQRNDGAPTVIDRAGSSKPGPPARVGNGGQPVGIVVGWTRVTKNPRGRESGNPTPRKPRKGWATQGLSTEKGCATRLREPVFEVPGECVTAGVRQGIAVCVNGDPLTSCDA